jgi:hypothetical protein
VLHRAFSFAVFGENPPLGQRIFLRGGDGGLRRFLLNRSVLTTITVIPGRE